MIIITCLHPSCRDQDGHRRIWREQCPDCARSIADSHTADSGHRIRIQRTPTLGELLADPNTRRLLGERTA